MWNSSNRLIHAEGMDIQINVLQPFVLHNVSGSYPLFVQKWAYTNNSETTIVRQTTKEK